MMRKYRAAFAIGRGVAWRKDGTFNQKHGISVTDVASWIDENLQKAWRSSDSELEAEGCSDGRPLSTLS